MFYAFSRLFNFIHIHLQYSQNSNINTYYTCNGNGRPVVLAHKKTLQDDLVEFSTSPAGQETVELECKIIIALIYNIHSKLLSTNGRLQK